MCCYVQVDVLMDVLLLSGSCVNVLIEVLLLSGSCVDVLTDVLLCQVVLWMCCLMACCYQLAVRM